ncbi:ATP-dependent DNA ligase [Piedraia hortae CBS 480.64]|uniref:DNA ligase 4 n=1 Tax=Piedraia hortae CBS 480.64 TaxID=1314780 RepID=A0A6A7C937_9PEZI|nr:ATP-dependent DNA ligase [Piedraia hortae CBS 480.64]
MYGSDPMTVSELNEKYPNRPHNRHKTLPFRDLYLTLFNPLNENRKKPVGPIVAHRHHVKHQSPHEIRRAIIERFIARWRKEVGNDIYPALRLIIPDKDRDRGMYGIKETLLGKMLVRVMKIDKNSEDGYNLLHWKLPGVTSSSAMAGDFAGRCFEVISKRAMRTEPGDMTIAAVNELLDRLSVATKEENQRPIVEEFYNRMNAEELMWLIRIILRQMKVGATEKTLFHVWHPDAEGLFNISSNLRRVCWELHDPKLRLDGDDRSIHLMQCFQPQLAAFQMKSVEYIISRMHPTKDDPYFWIEEKVDGERMQLHMVDDESVPGGKRFGFWSRKAKDYTYLYGNGLEDENSALTRHLKDAFHPGVRSIILDGEMITWDPQEDAPVPFGTLKSAALSEQANPFSGGNRPLFRVFDCLYLNGVALTRYTLRKRREALTTSVKSVHRRMEVHDIQEAKTVGETEATLRRVIAEGGEGLVLKNPRSEYRLNERNDDWIKLKPEYMTEFGEALDCVVIGGYYGSGRRGGKLSSFLCGLRLDKPTPAGTNPQKTWSFCRVGGGLAASDYAEISHRTEGRWHTWDAKNPPNDWIELGGWATNRQYERPDVWIKPEDSVVIGIKAASVTQSDQYRTLMTLRFPRFQKLRSDKSWEQALSVDEFRVLKENAEGEVKEKQFKIDDERRKRRSRKRKREMTVHGQEEEPKELCTAPNSQVFAGMTCLILSDSRVPKKTKAEIEQFVTANGGKTVATEKGSDAILIGDRKLVKVASLQKKDELSIVRPLWLFDCVQQGEVLPMEPRHVFYTATADHGKFEENVDKYGDSFVRNVTPAELLERFKAMSAKLRANVTDILDKLYRDGQDGRIFYGLAAYFEDAQDVRSVFEFDGGRVTDKIEKDITTHVVLPQGSVRKREIQVALAGTKRQPHIVTEDWVTDCWRERTLLDEKRKQVPRGSAF